jgi:hypothetical protein
MVGWSLPLLRLPQRVGLTGRVSLRLKGARTARLHEGTDHLLVLSGRMSC